MAANAISGLWVELVRKKIGVLSLAYANRADLKADSPDDEICE